MGMASFHPSRSPHCERISCRNTSCGGEGWKEAIPTCAHSNHHCSYSIVSNGCSSDHILCGSSGLRSSSNHGLRHSGLCSSWNNVLCRKWRQCCLKSQPESELADCESESMMWKFSAVLIRTSFSKTVLWQTCILHGYFFRAERSEQSFVILLLSSEGLQKFGAKAAVPFFLD